MAQRTSPCPGADATTGLPDLITRSELCSLLRISRATSYRLQGVYLPAPLRFGPGLVRWRRDEIDALLARAAADRPGRAA